MSAARTLMQCKGFIRVTVNDKMIEAPLDTVMYGPALVDLIKRLAQYPSTQSEHSTVKIELMKRQPKSPGDTFSPTEGLAADVLALIEMEEDELDPEIVRRESDPIFMKYRAIYSQKVFEEYTGEEMHMMREHVRTHYPEYPLKW